MKRITLVLCLGVFCLFAVMGQGCACSKVVRDDARLVPELAVAQVSKDSTDVSQKVQGEVMKPVPAGVQTAKQEAPPKAKAEVSNKPAGNQNPFDMDALIERLKASQAIGVFTKLALRSDALDLMDMVKAYRRDNKRMKLDEIRARFDGLLLKVLALLDDDPVLSGDISLAREGIWKSLLEVKA